jgi:hypothetical protein
MLPLMRRHPGLVVAHDIHLPALFRAAHAAGVWPGSVAAELEYNGEAGRDGPCGRPGRPGGRGRPQPAQPAGAGSRPARGRPLRVGLAAGPAGDRRPGRGRPPRRPPADGGTRAAERARLGLPGRPVRGLHPRPRRPAEAGARLIRAVAGLPADVRDRTALLVVGPVHPLDRDKLLADAAALGVADRVEVRGRVPLADFPAYAVAADVCVQLRIRPTGRRPGP